MTPRELPEPVEGYEPFFGLGEPPFSLTPDPRFLFASPSHAAALAQVAYAIQRREPLVIVSGEIGTGKTLLCRTVLQRLPGKTFLSVISDPLLDRDDLLKQMLEDFGVISKDRTRLTATSRHELVQALHAFLSSLAPLQAHAVVIVDEAQHLQPDVLEQIRLLANVDDARGTALAIILVGQTDLEERLSRPELRQLQQRVSRSLRLVALNREEVQQYIEHRLRLAAGDTPPSIGGDTPPLRTEDADFAWDLLESAGAKPSVGFTSDGFDAVSQLSRGVPRVINLLCDRALEEACASRLRMIDKPLIQAAARALGIVEPAQPNPPAALHLAARRTEVAPLESLATFAAAEPEPQAPRVVSDVAVAAPDYAAVARPAGATSMKKYLVLAASVVVVALVIFFAVHTLRSTTGAPTRPSAAASPAGRPSGAQPGATSQDAGSAAPTPAAGSDAAASANANVAAANGEQFDLVVASFRTDARATSVAADVAALGLPTRRRVSAGWQQVVAGPFPSRAAAETAQQRLTSAGLAGTQVTPTTR